MMCVIPNIPWIANLYLNGSQYGRTAVGCCLYPLCTFVGSSCTLEPVIHARAVSLKVCPSCPAQCLSFSRQPTSSSWAHYGRVLQNAMYDWYSHFRSGLELLEDKRHSERPSTGSSSRGEGADACRTTGNNQWGCKWSGYLVWISICNSDRGTADETVLFCNYWQTVKGTAERQLQVVCLRSQLRKLAS